MRISTKGRYAVTAMLDLAMHDQAGPVTLSDISRAQDISLSYLEQLFAKLRKRNLVKGVRGPGGGYRLAKVPADISIADIISAIEEPVDATNCGGCGDCQGGEMCLTHQLWTDLSVRLHNFLDGISLAKFVSEPGIREIANRQDEESRRMNFIFPRPET